MSKNMKTPEDDLTDKQWNYIAHLFPEQEYCDLSLREVINAIFYQLRTGCQWRKLDSAYPNWNSVYYHYDKWKKDGRFVQMNDLLHQLVRKKKGRDPRPSLVSIDSQSVKVAPLINEEVGVDGHKRINGRKRHIVTDTLGLIIGVAVSAANKYDGTVGVRLFGQIKDLLSRTKKVLADGSYKGGFESFVQDTMDIEVEISSRPPTEKGFVPIKFRWVTERTFGWFNFFRRLSKDYEKTTSSSANWILLANIRIMLNKLTTN